MKNFTKTHSINIKKDKKIQGENEGGENYQISNTPKINLLKESILIENNHTTSS